MLKNICLCFYTKLVPRRNYLIILLFRVKIKSILLTRVAWNKAIWILNKRFNLNYHVWVILRIDMDSKWHLCFQLTRHILYKIWDTLSSNRAQFQPDQFQPKSIPTWSIPIQINSKPINSNSFDTEDQFYLSSYRFTSIFTVLPCYRFLQLLNNKIVVFYCFYIFQHFCKKLITTTKTNLKCYITLL